ncbi:MAG: RNA polymerase sigma factor RpoE [Burkholderiaceae bacterium]|jgi:RNA polymerase sigma-70 factor, ECF subfamily|nr:RNA polymerase sigma factor RpoE [Burkholderiaceae bacterium]
MPERESDQVLVERVQAGDKKAFDLLVSKYHQRVIRLISRLVRNPAEVEDIAQEAFIKAYRSIGQFRGDSAFYTWLYRIAVNSAKNALMASNRRPIPMSDLMKSDENEEGEAWPVESAIDFQTPEALLASRQVAQTVDAAIESLAEDLRTAIMLREIEGLTYEEIAEAMNCPIGTVRSRIFRARETIAKQLRPLLDTPENKRW